MTLTGPIEAGDAGVPGSVLENERAESAGIFRFPNVPGWAVIAAGPD